MMATVSDALSLTLEETLTKEPLTPTGRGLIVTYRTISILFRADSQSPLNPSQGYVTQLYNRGR